MRTFFPLTCRIVILLKEMKQNEKKNKNEKKDVQDDANKMLLQQLNPFDA